MGANMTDFVRLKNISALGEKKIESRKEADFQKLSQLSHDKTPPQTYLTIVKQFEHLLDPTHFDDREYIKKLKEFKESLQMSLPMHLNAWKKTEIQFEPIKVIFHTLERDVLDVITQLSDALRITSQEAEVLRKFYDEKRHHLSEQFKSYIKFSNYLQLVDETITETINNPFDVVLLSKAKTNLIQDYQVVHGAQDLPIEAKDELKQMIERLLNYLELMILEIHQKNMYYIKIKLNLNVIKNAEQFLQKLSSKENFATYFATGKPETDVSSSLFLQPGLNDTIYLGVLMPYPELLGVVQKLRSYVPEGMLQSKELLQSLFPKTISCHSIPFGSYRFAHQGNGKVEVIPLANG